MVQLGRRETHLVMRADDPLSTLFKAACSWGGGNPDSLEAGSETPVHDGGGHGLRRLCITSEHQWRLFADSLASEGLVVELSEQQQLQKLWDRAVVGASAFGRRVGPSLSIEDVYQCVDEMYADDDISADIGRKIDRARESTTELQALLEDWDLQSFSQTQTRQALQVVHRLEQSHRRSIQALEQEQREQKGHFIADCVLRLIGEADRSEGGEDAFGGDKGKPVSAAAVECNPHLWQSNNAGLVDQKVTKARVNVIRYPTKPATATKHYTKNYGGAEDDVWGLSQGLAGTQGIACRRGFAKRSHDQEETPMTVLVMPKAALGYAAREKLWRCLLAHRQLAAGSCVMRSLGVADRDPEETLFYYEHVKARSASALLSSRRLHEGDVLFRHWARGALVCLAQISEQSTFSLEGRVSMSNLMIGAKGCVVRLGGLRWAPELLRVGHTAGGDRSDLRQERDTDLCHGLADILEGKRYFYVDLRQERDAELCHGLADVLEGLLGAVPGERAMGAREKRSGNDVPVCRSRDGRSLALANILACLRLPPRFRRGITLKSLQGHQFFAPLPPARIKDDLLVAWKNFTDHDDN